MALSKVKDLQEPGMTGLCFVLDTWQEARAAYSVCFASLVSNIRKIYLHRVDEIGSRERFVLITEHSQATEKKTAAHVTQTFYCLFSALV